MANPAKDLLCHSAKKREGKAKILPHYCISRRAVRHSATCPAIALAAADAVIKRGWISPCGDAGGAISPLQNKKAGGTPRRSQSPQKKLSPHIGNRTKLKKFSLFKRRIHFFQRRKRFSVYGTCTILLNSRKMSGGTVTFMNFKTVFGINFGIFAH